MKKYIKKINKSDFGAEQILKAIQIYSKIKAKEIEIALEFRTLGQKRPYQKIPSSNFIRMVELREELMDLHGGNKKPEVCPIKNSYVEV